MYRIEIDRSLCGGFGACVEVAPRVIEVGPDGLATTRTGPSDDPAVVRAAEACPMGAISVVQVEAA